MQQWTVTRQFPYYYNSGNETKTYTVEVAMGDFNYVGPGMQTPKYDGEGDTFTSLVEAVETAIRIRDQWRKDSPDLDIEIGTGATGGGMFEIEPTDMDDDELRTWAQKRDEDEMMEEEDDETIDNDEYYGDAMFEDNEYSEAMFEYEEEEKDEEVEDEDDEEKEEDLDAD